MNSDFSSHAGNFCDALETQVDPRTGQFMLNFPVAHLIGNHQLGPELALSLRYSPLNSGNYGFGNGFSLSITQFNNRTRLLELMSGESYRVFNGSDKVQNQKLDNFRFRFTNGSDDTDGYTVTWKDGKVEKLSKTYDDETFVTTTIVSPLGRRLTLKWDWTGQFSLISKIEDESQTLCEIVYDGMTQVNVWPNTPDFYQLNFNFINDQLDEVNRHVSESETFRWYFIYDNVGHSGNRLTLTGVDYPTGMTDRVDYNQEDGFKFPEGSAANSKLPCVLTHRRYLGGNQPDSVSQFEYTGQNFLGHNGNFGEWSADSDYLFTTLTDYTYGSTETVVSNDVIVKTERTYNNYHLQIEENVNREGNFHTTEMIYYAEKDCFIDDQPAQFKLLKEKRVKIHDANGNDRPTKVLTEFDEHGNPTKQVDPDGTQTVYTWYHKDGEDGCPAEPNGFVRFIKEKRVIPPKITGLEPEHSTKYTYSTLRDTPHVVQEAQTTSSNEKLLKKRSFEYEHGKGSSEFGRITAIKDILYDLADESKSYATVQRFDTTVSDNRIHQKTTTTAHDGLQTTASRTQSVFSGNLHSEVSSLGIETRHFYDGLGRLKSQTVSPDSEFENTSNVEHGIDTNGPYTIETDAYGNKKRTNFDGSARAIGHHIFNAETDKWYEASSISHNSLGEVVSGNVKDWKTSTDVHFPLKSDTIYDGWGEKMEVHTSDGKIHAHHVDPINLTKTILTRATVGTSSLSTGSVTTTLDPNLLVPLNKVSKDINGDEYTRLQYKWNGLRQMHEEHDESGGVTTRTYDEYGRVLTQTSPDGTVVTRTYAPHLTGNQIASISVTGLDANGTTRTWLLGTQTFDGFGRLKQSASGGRITSYEYEGVSLKPSKVILPSGKTVSHTYIPELSYAVSSTTCDGITQHFEYDKKTGEMISAREADSEITNTWSLKGELTEETFSYSGQSRNAKHEYTLNGAPLSYTDITGKQTKYELDSHGRVNRITDDNMLVDIEYDVLGRVKSQTVHDTKTASLLTTARSYDDFGREISRMVTNGTGMILIVSQTWHKSGLLATRTTIRNNIELRKETYEYDKRKRLLSYSVTGDSLPVDGYGKPMLAQSYRYDALNNITSLVTTLSDRSTDTAKFFYLNGDDPTQLTKVTHTDKKYPNTINLSYDIEGRMTCDESGRTLAYDILGRLVSVSENGIEKGTYTYDALNRLITQNAGGNDIRELYYRGSELVNEVRKSQKREKRLIKTGHTCLGVSDESGLTLTAGDQNDSLLWSLDTKSGNKDGDFHVWSPYGNGKSNDNELPGFNGERIDPVSGTYHLGNGYRAYNPVLMRFNCPDDLSPFGEGGINSYAYCAGDPVNHIDPSGHISWQGILGITLGAIGLGLAVFTAGASIAAAGGVMAAISSASAASLIIGGIGVVSDVTAIASGALEDVDPKASSILGWVSLGTGLVGLAAGVKGLLKGKLKLRGKTVHPGAVEGSIYKLQVKSAWFRKPKWHPIWHNGKMIYGADQEINALHVESMVTKLEEDMARGAIPRKPIVIFSGTHGDPTGLNWVGGVRDKGLISNLFFEQDKELTEIFAGVKVKASKGWTRLEYTNTLNGEDAHVILGFCFGRNEQTLTELLHLPVVPTYTTGFLKSVFKGEILLNLSRAKPWVWAHSYLYYTRI